VASRSEDASSDSLDSDSDTRASQPVGHEGVLRRRWPRRDDVAFDELRIEIRVSYRTLLVIFSLFVGVQRVIDALGGIHLPL